MKSFSTFLFGLLLAIPDLSPVVKAESPRLRVGVIAPLTGEVAAYGQAIRNGIALAQEDDPVAKNIEFIFEDDRYEGKLSAQAFQKLVGPSKANMLWTFGSVAGHVVAPLAESNRIPMLNFGYEFEFTVGKNYVMRSLGDISLYTALLVQSLRDKGVTNFSLLITDLTFIRSMVSSVRSNLKPTEILTEIASFPPSETDFRPMILRLKKSGIKYIGLFMLPEQILQFGKQSEELKSRFKIYGTDFFESAAKIGNSPKFLEGGIYPDNAVDEGFARRYQGKFLNSEQLTFAGSAYDMTRILAAISQKLRLDNNADEIVAQYKALPPGEGVLGKYRFVDSKKKGKYYDYPIFVKVVKDGRGQVVNVSS